MAIGFIWARYSLVIIPRVWNLFAVNFFLGLAGSTQLFRIWRYISIANGKNHLIRQVCYMISNCIALVLTWLCAECVWTLCTSTVLFANNFRHCCNIVWLFQVSGLAPLCPVTHPCGFYAIPFIQPVKIEISLNSRKSLASDSLPLPIDGLPDLAGHCKVSLECSGHGVGQCCLEF